MALTDENQSMWGGGGGGTCSVPLCSKQIPWNSLKCKSCLSFERSQTNTVIPQYYEISLRAVRLCVHVALERSAVLLSSFTATRHFPYYSCFYY